MAWNGSGVYSRIYNWVADRNAAINITASRHDGEDDSIAGGLNNCLTKNGENTPTTNLPMGAFRHTNVANAVARNDYAAAGQVQDDAVRYAAGGGTADAITATYSPAVAAVVDGMLLAVRATGANTITTPTFSPNGLTARTIVKQGGQALAVGDIRAVNHDLLLRYRATGTVWELLNPVAASPSAASETVAGIAEIATQAEVNAGTDDARFVTPLKLENWNGLSDISFKSQVINGEIIESHAANAVTYTLKGKGGVDLSASNVCKLLFPSGTLTSGGFDTVSLTANISVTVSSGSTLGHASAIPQHSFVYAINNAGTAELAVSNLPPDYPGVLFGLRKISTTAEGGAGAADSPTGIYSTAARSNVTWLPLTKVLGTQTTAGTWAATPTQIDMVPFNIPVNAFRAYKDITNQTLTNATFTKATLTDETFDIDAVFDAVTNSRHQPNVAGLYEYDGAVTLTNAVVDNQIMALIYLNGVAVAEIEMRISAVSADGAVMCPALVVMNGTTDFVELYAFQANGTASAKDIYPGSHRRWLEGTRITGGQS